MNHKTLALICLLALALAALVGCTSAATTSTAESTSETTTADATAETADTAAATDTTTDDATTDSTTSDSADALQFPVDSYTEETVTVTTSTGDVEVTYRLYSHIPYVANPVNTDYQSLDVKVPVSINGEAIDATNAPMLLVINVGGYMSVNNAEGGAGVGAPVGGLTEGELPEGADGEPPAGMGGTGDDSGVSGASDLALAAGALPK